MPIECKHGRSNAPSHHTIFNCFREFQLNKFSVQDAPCSTRPSTSVTEQTIDVVRKLIEDDSHSTYQQIEANLRKVCGGWVPLTLTHDQKQLPLQLCHHSLKRFEGGRSCRVIDIITGDESCFYHYDHELKEQ